jgi:hypothetical protein
MNVADGRTYRIVDPTVQCPSSWWRSACRAAALAPSRYRYACPTALYDGPGGRIAMQDDRTQQLADGATTAGGGRRVLVSHAGPDTGWAEWVAWYLDAAGYQVELDRWDWETGSNFVFKMNAALEAADAVVAIWSAAYFEPGRFTGDEWTAVFAAREKLVPLRIETVTPPPLLAPMMYRTCSGSRRRRHCGRCWRLCGLLAGRRPRRFFRLACLRRRQGRRGCRGCCPRCGTCRCGRRRL